VKRPPDEPQGEPRSRRDRLARPAPGWPLRPGVTVRTEAPQSMSSRWSRRSAGRPKASRSPTGVTLAAPSTRR
jgi:hypothetical protein